MWCLELNFLIGRREFSSLFYCSDFDMLIIAYSFYVL
nr:MAG TPA: hypothetical protein [Caudoviricetes sp.]DAT28807.1 MAG TPA: hypothetical protein [Caudoviricetes sp.]